MNSLTTRAGSLLRAPAAPRRARSLILAVALVTLIVALIIPAQAGTITVALSSSGGVPGVAGASFDFPATAIFVPLLNGKGQVAFFGALTGSGINTDSNGNSVGLWAPDAGGNLSLIARLNSGGVPNVPGGSFTNLNNLFFFNDNGGVAFAGNTTANLTGVWGSVSAGSLGTITYGDSIPGMPGAKYQGGINLQAFNNSGKIVYKAVMQTGFGGVSNGNTSGLWGPDAAGNLALLARWGVGGVPGVPGANFGSNPAYYPVLDAAGHVAFKGNLDTGVGGVTNSTNEGLWGPDASGNLSLIARTGSGGVPGVSGANFSSFNADFVDIANGRTAFGATLQTGVGGVTSTNNQGVWGPDALGNLGLIARTGSDGVPGVAGANFATLAAIGSYALNANGKVIFAGTLQTGLAGVTSSNDSGLWGPNPAGNLTLIAREGSGGVPGVAGANFTGTFNTALNGNGNVLFRGTLQTGVGGVTSSTNLGIWIGDGIELLQVARTGGSLAGLTLNDLNLNNGTGGDDGHQTSFNSFGQVAYLAGFTNNKRGMMLFTPDLHWRTTGSGTDTWNNRLKWTLSLDPAFVHDTFIDPATNVIVTGPTANVTVKTLAVGGGAGTAELQMQPGVVLTANSFKITTNGAISSIAGAATATLAGPVNLDGGTRTFTVANGAAGIDLAISGNVSNGSLMKSGLGLLQLQGASNTHTNTTVLDGVLHVTGALANNGSNRVFVGLDTDGNFATPGPRIDRNVSAGASYTGIGSAANGGLLTRADIRFGKNAAGGTVTVGMAWRARNAAETPSATVPGLISDVLDLTGLGAGERYVLQLSYDPAQLRPGGGLFETTQAAAGNIFLGWLDPNGIGPGVPRWENAVLGNTAVGGSRVEKYLADFDGGGSFAGGSWDNFALQFSITDANLGNYLGSWGVDTTNNVAWAVLDHNSQFAAMPEPASLVQLLSALAVLAGFRFRRRARA